MLKNIEFVLYAAALICIAWNILVWVTLENEVATTSKKIMAFLLPPLMLFPYLYSEETRKRAVKNRSAVAISCVMLGIIIYLVRTALIGEQS